MTVTAAEARKEYAGNGVVTSFSYPSQFYQSNDLEVWLFDNVTEVGALQVIGTDYTVTGVMNPTGGTVDFTVAPPVDTTVIIINSPDITQLTHYINADDFPADSHEQALDRLTKIAQRLDDKISRTIRSPDWTPEEDVPDAETLVGLVQDAEDAAANSANSAAASAASANAAQASQTAAANSAFVASGHVISAEEAATEAAASADAAAASATAADVAKIEWQGAWNSATAYAPNDAVQVGGSSYISKTSNTNKNPPSNPADWDLMAQKGADASGGGGGGGDMLAANNLSDVASVPASRNNLGLKGAAILDVGTTAGTVAAGDDARFASLQSQISANDADIATNAAAIATKAPTASPAFSGDPTVPTPAAADNDTSIANTAWVNAAIATAIAGKAPLASPVFTGNPQAPTPTAGDNDTSIATTAFVKAAIDAVSSPAKLNGQIVTKLAMQGFNNYHDQASTTSTGLVSAVITKDGAVKFAGNASAALPSYQRGDAQSTMLKTRFTKAPLPNALLGTPASVVFDGYENSFILTDQGDVCGAGLNNSGQLGVGDIAVHGLFTLLSATNIGPRSVSGAARAVMQIMGAGCGNESNHTNSSVWFRCADGTLWACGYNGVGQLADGTTVAKNVPTQCLKNDGAGNVAVNDCAKVFAWGGQNSSVGYIDTSGKVRLAGNLASGAAGRNTATAGSTVFRPIFTTTDIAGSQLPAAYQALDIVGSPGDTVVIRCADKCCYAWGLGTNGQIGNGAVTSQNNPIKVGNGTAVAATLNGTMERVFSCAFRSGLGAFLCQLTDGSIYGWGYNGINAMPINVAGNVSTPTNARGLLAGAGLPNIIGLGGGGQSVTTQVVFGCLLLADGRVMTWGSPALDGNGASFTSSDPRLMPIPKKPTQNVVALVAYSSAVSADPRSTVHILLDDGTLLGLGFQVPMGADFVNESGMLGPVTQYVLGELQIT